LSLYLIILHFVDMESISNFPCIIKVGDVTNDAISLLLNLSFNNDDTFPTKWKAISLTLVNGLIKITAPGFLFDDNFITTPVPIDLPNNIICDSSNLK